jgi:hypothetical protein
MGCFFKFPFMVQALKAMLGVVDLIQNGCLNR